MQRHPSPLTFVGGAVALLTTTWTVASGVVPVADAVTALLVPALFVIAGLLGPLWRAASFTCALLVGIGSLHLSALALSALALHEGPGSVVWHVTSQVLFVGGLALLLPLAAGYPAGPGPRWAWILAAAASLVPVVTAFAGPTPTVLSATDATGAMLQLGPIAAVLPAELAAGAGVVFLMPAVAMGIAVVRLVRGDRELRGRLTLPLGALGAFAVVLMLGSIVPASAAGAGTALFLVSAPLLPVGLIAGSRPTTLHPADLEAHRRLRAHEASDDRLEALSPRERQVLELMADGHSNPAIGRALHISLSAVEKHATSIFGKLGVAREADTHRRVAAVVAYLRAVRR
ncbi:LuxR C-terminal-related transcriptional regulator [Agromyces sp. Marseille-P2726]|uniref:LuxR C-terminal-related transcriptional regulator n=1 Tax=Agromyces sp. Marseille-P2726 TaxID=2709132 RepID=UPI0020C498BA|nr:LuxR C-terminal-related transcriptional regulator [Agromyces sp. Marseille-P2726]